MDMKVTDGPKPLEGPTSEAPEYPPGLRIYLTAKELEKLMLGRDLVLGEDLMIKGMACVVELSQDEMIHGNDGKRAVLQIKELEAEDSKSESDKFYGE
jgi:hypothetical protein